MINIKKIFISIIIYLSLINFGYSQINFKIIMKINSEIITSYDLEKEINYLLALNPQLKNIDKNDLNKIAKRSIVKEVIRKNEILKYKKQAIKLCKNKSTRLKNIGTELPQNNSRNIQLVNKQSQMINNLESMIKKLENSLH